jgi:DNA polymerase-3 subunit delta
MPQIHAFDFLGRAAMPTDALPPVMVVVGSDSTLRSWVIGRLMADADVAVMEGVDTKWIDLHDELSTASLFSMGELRTVVVRGGDPLVKDCRAELEQHFAKPGSTSRLILEVELLPSNTRLYKAAEQEHLVIGCSAPQITAGRNQHPDIPRIRKFLIETIAPKHQTRLTEGAATTLIEMLGDQIGMLDSEIAKLAVHLEVGGTITEALVRDVVAGWIGKTMWEINDAAAGGNATEALRHLDKLIIGGQAPIALLPQLAWALRRLGMATAVVDQIEATGRRPTPQDGLKGVGFKGRPEDFKKAEYQMKQLGRDRARKLLTWLLETDLMLKGSHSAAPRDRWAIEELVCRLAKRG